MWMGEDERAAASQTAWHGHVQDGPKKPYMVFVVITLSTLNNFSRKFASGW